MVHCCLIHKNEIGLIPVRLFLADVTSLETGSCQQDRLLVSPIHLTTTFWWHIVGSSGMTDDLSQTSSMLGFGSSR